MSNSEAELVRQAEDKLSVIDIVAFLADITFIFDHHEKLGTIKSKLLVDEFHYWEAKLNERMEKINETRKRSLDPKRHQDGADLPSSQSRRSEPDRHPRGDGTGD